MGHHVFGDLFHRRRLVTRVHSSRILRKFAGLEVPVPEDAQAARESSVEIFGCHADRKDSQSVHSRSCPYVFRFFAN